MSSQFFPHRGQTPQVSNVFHTQQHLASHIHVSEDRGTHLHCGQNILMSLIHRLTPIHLSRRHPEHRLSSQSLDRILHFERAFRRLSERPPPTTEISLHGLSRVWLEAENSAVEQATGKSPEPANRNVQECLRYRVA